MAQKSRHDDFYPRTHPTPLVDAGSVRYFPRSDRGFANTDYRASVTVTVAVSNSSAGLFAASAVITSFSGLLVGAVSRMFRRHMRSQKRLQWVQVCTILSEYILSDGVELHN